MSRGDSEPPQPHWFQAGRKTEDYGYALAPLCRHCGNTLSHPLHNWHEESDGYLKDRRTVLADPSPGWCT